MPIAEISVTVEGLLIALLVGIAGFVMLWLTNASTLQRRINELTTRVFALQDQQVELRQKEAECRIENTNLRAEVQSSLKRIQKLETTTGSAEVGVVGVIVADLKGYIRVFSPTLVQLFKWLPEELRGKHVSILMPDETKKDHQSKFDKFVLDQDRHLDPSKVILTTGKDKYGNPVKVAITLDGFQVGQEGLVTATVRNRQSGLTQTERDKNNS